MIKVSVVVPVYNPGSYIDPLVDSLLGQTLSPDEFEAIFVDDGSTDDTPERLDRLSAGNPHFRVIHQPNSGWPGKPRNVGIDAARGEFIYFVDHDDYLARDALDRLYDRAVATSADVAIGRVVGKDRTIAYNLFRERNDHASLATTRLEMTLTPHKLFRTAMLNEHGIRFPEGKRRLEDYPFVLQSYFTARNVAMLGEAPCYFFTKRSDGGNSSATRIEPVGYYRDLREAIDVVEANTQPGELRDRILRRFYDRCMLRKLREPRIVRLPDDYRKELFEQVRLLAEERFPATVAAGLSVANRLRAALVQRGDLVGLVTFGERCNQIVARAELREARWTENDVIRIDFTAELGYPDGQPLRFVPTRAGLQLDPRLKEGLFVQDDQDAADFKSAKAVKRTASLKLVLRDRYSGIEWRATCTTEARLEPATDKGPDARTLSFTGTAHVAPLETEPSSLPVPRNWEISAEVSLAGFARSAHLHATTADAVEPAQQRSLGERGWPVHPHLSAGGSLRITVGSRKIAGVTAKRADTAESSHGLRAGTTRSWARRSDGQIHLELHVPKLDSHGASTQLRLNRGKSITEVSAELHHGSHGPVAVADIPARSLGTGTWRLEAQTGPSARYKRVNARLVLHSHTPVALLTGSAPTKPRRPPRRPSSPAARVGRSVASAADALLRELPPARAARYRRALERAARVGRSLLAR